MNNTDTIVPVRKVPMARKPKGPSVPTKLYDIGQDCYVTARPKDVRELLRPLEPNREYLKLYSELMSEYSLTLVKSEYVYKVPAVYTDEQIFNLLIEPPEFPLQGRNYERHDYRYYRDRIVCPWSYECDIPLFHKVLDFLRSVGHVAWESPKISCRKLHVECPIKASPLFRIAYERHRSLLVALARFAT
jgi:hypothetical protein